MSNIDPDSWVYVSDNLEYDIAPQPNNSQDEESNVKFKPLKIVYKHTLSSVLNDPNVYSLTYFDTRHV